MGRDPGTPERRGYMQDFNPPSPCGEGHEAGKCTGGVFRISIHPPRVGRDACCLASMKRGTHFNPPSPCGEGQLVQSPNDSMYQFQSTLPVWGGTGIMAMPQIYLLVFQSTLPVWGGTGRNLPARSFADIFQSTLPVWGGTRNRLLPVPFNTISIHPPRVGRDGIRA